MPQAGDTNRMAMLAIFVGELNAGIEAELGSSIERPSVDDLLVAKLKRVAQAVRTRVAREFNVEETEIALPHIYRGVDDLVVDLPDEQRRACTQLHPAPITTVEASSFADVIEGVAPGALTGWDRPEPTCAECGRLAAAEQAETARADIAEEEVARLERQLTMVSRAFGLIKERAQLLQHIDIDERAVLNLGVIIEHIVEAAEGDEGAAASIRVLGIEWEDAG
ncbi:MAG: hypothetical protein GY838_13150 [bacterium]|nr:hypothetical protein [bacterium]